MAEFCFHEKEYDLNFVYFLDVFALFVIKNILYIFFIHVIGYPFYFIVDYVYSLILQHANTQISRLVGKPTMWF